MHLRLWLAEQIADQVDAVGLAGAPWVTYYARALGAKIGHDVDLHTLPPITGMLEIGDAPRSSPRSTSRGYWIDGDVLRIGAVRIGADATIGARSTLAPGTRIGQRAEIAPGSAVFGRVRADQSWAGSPAARVGGVGRRLARRAAARRRRAGCGRTPCRRSCSACCRSPPSRSAASSSRRASGAPTISAVGLRALARLARARPTLTVGVVFAASVVLLVRLLSIGLDEGTHPVRSRVGWQAWTIERLMDSSRTILFPLYSSLFTPVWLRMLGAEVGRDVEASTVLLIPSMTRIDDGAFLADDTMVASYELRGGWLRIGPVRIGKRAFLGNSGMAAPGHRVPRDGLVAVLSSAPLKAKPGSSWLGSPAVRLRRVSAEGDESRTYRPHDAAPRRAGAVGARAASCRCSSRAAIGLVVLFGLAALLDAIGPRLDASCSPAS